jgi:hypothetical protein
MRKNKNYSRNHFSAPTGGHMPSDESRRLLKAFGVAMTDFEDAVHRNDPADSITKAEALVRSRLEELSALIERLRRHAAAA